jgi:hypothetical protein
MAAGDVITIVEDCIAKKGVYFDGTDDYILVDAHAVERVAANDTVGTYTAWIYLNPYASGDKNILSAGDNDSATEYFSFLVNGTKDLQANLYHGGAWKWRLTAGQIPTETWTHVAVVQDGVKPKFYVNGVARTVTDITATDTTSWYDLLSGCDKFAIGVLESNNTHTNDFNGAIGTVKYWNRALSAAEIYKDFNGETLANGDYPEATYLRLNITMDNNGTTDSGAGADNGTLTGNAHYGGLISSHSIALEANTSGHAAEKVNTWQVSPNKLCSVIVRGD